ncbi:MAG: AraC family transcriptional regulator [Bacteroidota bacterium]
MIIQAFLPDQGFYQFEATNLTTDFHAHPAIEIIIALEGRFSVNGRQEHFDSVRGICINRQVSHQLIAPDCRFQLMMLEDLYWTQESLASILPFSLEEEMISFDPSVFAADFAHHIPTPRQLDLRVKEVAAFIQSHLTEQDLSLPALAERVHLSPSRLSHLFKVEMGQSLQHFISWSRLKKCIQISLQNGIHLQEAALEAGFFDPPHFSRRFKQFFGIKASATYNSQIVQESGRDTD